ncbi:MAG: mechanosensitive ion channel [bacterium]|nr:mechanosensitive ion channel [bacterium]
MTSTSDLHIIFEQLQVLRIFLGRLIVQRQILASLAAFILAWALSDGLWYLAERYVKSKRPTPPRSDKLPWRQQHRKHGLFLLKQLLFPLLGFAFMAYFSRYFAAQEWRSGLFSGMMFFLRILLLYRLTLTLLYIFLGDGYMGHYHARLFTPLFALSILYWGGRTLLDLQALSEFPLITVIGHSVTAGSMIASVVSLYFLFTTSRAVQELIQNIIVPKTEADPNVIQAALTIGRYIVIAGGVIIVAVSLGANMSTLAFISGGLSVGIGFGLQQIVANFISGILLLFEQTLRPGDVVSIEDEMGIVQKLSIRSTTIRTMNHVEVIVPNEKLLTSAVQTYTRSNRLFRVLLDVGASYDSEPEEIKRLLLEVAQRHPDVLQTPPPIVFFKEFGASSIDFQLGVWLRKPALTPRVKSDLLFMIWDEFAKNQIEIPFPQRDLHIRSGLPWEQPTG